MGIQVSHIQDAIKYLAETVRLSPDVSSVRITANGDTEILYSEEYNKRVIEKRARKTRERVLCSIINREKGGVPYPNLQSCRQDYNIKGMAFDDILTNDEGKVSDLIRNLEQWLFRKVAAGEPEAVQPPARAGYNQLKEQVLQDMLA